MRVTKAREFADGSRFKVSTYVPTGIEMENIPQGSAQIGNDNSITGLTNRKGSVATVSSHDRNRKMSRDVIPSIEHYRTQPTQQVQTTVRRPTMNELCNPANEEVQLQNTNEVQQLDIICY
jgi:hypothetical protein